MHNLFGVDFWITSANLLYLASYSVRDILWLRVLTVVAAGLLIPYYYLQPAPLWVAIAWNLLFTVINLYWITRLLLQRRPVQLSVDEQQLRELCFPELSAADVSGICKLGTWENIDTGTCLVEHDRTLQRLSAILSGKADVWLGDAQVAELAGGQFVGQIALVTGENTPVSVTAREPMRVLSWPRETMESFLRSRPDVAVMLGRSLDAELVRLLKASWQTPHRGP